MNDPLRVLNAAFDAIFGPATDPPMRPSDYAGRCIECGAPALEHDVICADCKERYDDNDH